jgi:hypothetical protein
MTGFKLEVQCAAIVITDPQVDFLSPQGTAWALVGESVDGPAHHGAGVLPAFKPYFLEDATAAATLSDGDGYQAALINFHHIADAVWSTDEAVRQM